MNKPDGNEWDGAIEKVLAGLCEAQAPEGLERRILEGLEHRAARRWSWGPMLNWMAAGGLAVAMLTFSVVAARHRSGVAPGPGAGSARGPAFAINSMGAIPPQLAVDRVVGANVSTVSRRVKLMRRSSRVVSRDVFPAPRLIAMGFPAPPMPLTEQEKLLLQVARRGVAAPAPMLNPTPVPMLDPDELALREAKSEAAFQAFLGTKTGAETDVEQQIQEVDRKGESQ